MIVQVRKRGNSASTSVQGPSIFGCDRFNWILGFCVFAMLDATVQGTDVTLTAVPIGGVNATGGQLIDVERFFTANRTIRIEGGQVDFPCVILADPGGAGSLTAVLGCTDCDGNGINSSTAGVPFLFGLPGISPYKPSNCIMANTPALGQLPVVVPLGATRYIGTVRYQVSDCAAGHFQINFECTDQPGGGRQNARTHKLHTVSQE